MATVTSHDTNFTINITLESSALAQAGFGTVLFMVDEAGGNGLGGDRVATYASLAEATAANTAGEISAGTLAALTAAFAQRPQPSQIKVGRVDTGGGETYATAYELIKTADSDFYGVCLDKRTATEILLVAAKTEAENRLLVFQSADADWLTSGTPSAFSAAAAYENSAVVYHDTATVWADVALAVNRLTFDPDTISVPWDCPIQGVSAYATALTTAQRNFALANDCNVLGSLGGSPNFIDPGVNLNGRPLYEIVTAHWLEARLAEGLAALKVNESAVGRKIPLTARGQSQVAGVLRSVFELGVLAGHFVEGQTEVVPLALTSADITAQRMRFTARAQLVTSGRVFTFTINLGTSALSAA